nr:transmembrane protein [Tanacetum cinerariifolium]
MFHSASTSKPQSSTPSTSSITTDESPPPSRSRNPQITIEEYLRPILWAVLCSIPLRGIQETLVSFWSEPLEKGLVQTVLAVPLFIYQVFVGTLVEIKDFLDKLVTRGKINNPVKKQRALLTKRILIRLETIVAIGLIVGMILGSFVGIVFFRMRLGLKGKMPSFPLSHMLKRVITLRKIGLRQWMDDNNVPGMVDKYTTKFYETVNEHVDSLAVEYNVTEIVQETKQLVTPICYLVNVFVLGMYLLCWSLYLNNHSAPTTALATLNPYTENILSLKKVVINREWSTIYPKVTAILNEVQVSKEEMIKKAKAIVFQGTDVLQRVLASSISVVGGSTKLVAIVINSIVSGAAEILDFVSKAMLFIGVLYALITLDSGGVTEHIMNMIPMSRSARTRSVKVFDKAIFGVLLASAEIAVFQGYYGTAEIQESIPGYNGYLTGLSIIGGVALFPSAVEGATMGPLIATLVIDLKDLYTKFVLDTLKEETNYPTGITSAYFKSHSLVDIMLYTCRHLAALHIYYAKEMDLFAFIRHSDPTKVRIGERDLAKREVKLLKMNEGHTVSLDPPATAAFGGSGDSIDKLFGEGDDAGQENSVEKDDDVLDETIARDVSDVAVEKAKKNRKESGKSLATLRGLVLDSSGIPSGVTKPFIAAFVAPTQDVGPTDSVFGLNLRTCPPNVRCLVADALVVTVVVTTIVVADVAAISGSKARKVELEDKCAEQATLLSERDAEIVHLKSLLSLKEAEAAKVIRLRGQLTTVSTLEFANAAKEAELAFLSSQVAKLTSDMSDFQLSRDEFNSQVASLESKRDGLINQRSLLKSAFELFSAYGGHAG